MPPKKSTSTTTAPVNDVKEDKKQPDAKKTVGSSVVVPAIKDRLKTCETKEDYDKLFTEYNKYFMDIRNEITASEEILDNTVEQLELLWEAHKAKFGETKKDGAQTDKEEVKEDDGDKPTDGVEEAKPNEEADKKLGAKGTKKTAPKKEEAADVVEEPKVDESKKVAVKAAPKKAAPKKSAEPVTEKAVENKAEDAVEEPKEVATEPKKAAPKKAEPKKAEPKKAEPKKAAPKKAADKKPVKK
jgi:hypothetical protein